MQVSARPSPLTLRFLPTTQLQPERHCFARSRNFSERRHIHLHSSPALSAPPLGPPPKGPTLRRPPLHHSTAGAGLWGHLSDGLLHLLKERTHRSAGVRRAPLRLIIQRILRPALLRAVTRHNNLSNGVDDLAQRQKRLGHHPEHSDSGVRAGVRFDAGAAGGRRS